MTARSSQNALCRSLGSEYEIKVIDLERCIYRDFHNGFEIEISGSYTTSKKMRCSIYLWYDQRGPFLNYHDIPQDRLPEVLGFYEKLIEQLIERGLNTPEKMVELRDRAQRQYFPDDYNLPKAALADRRKLICINSEYMLKWMGSYLDLLWKTMEEMSYGVA